MKHLGTHDYPEIVKVLEKHREEWGDQVRIGPPPEGVAQHLIGVYLEDASIPLREA